VIWKYFVAALFAGLLDWNILQLLSSDWSRFAKLSVSFLIYTCLYMILVVIIHRNIQPIIEIFSVIKEMFPRPAMPVSKS
jgi:hypothetical protein